MFLSSLVLTCPQEASWWSAYRPPGLPRPPPIDPITQELRHQRQICGGIEAGDWQAQISEGLRMDRLGKSTGVTSMLCSYCVKLTTSDLFLPAVVAGEIQLSKTETLFSSRNPTHSFVCVVKHATLTSLGIHNDSISFTAHLQRHNPSSVTIGNARNPSSCTGYPVTAALSKVNVTLR